MSAPHACTDCGVVFDSVKSLDVHLHYHKENLMSKWIAQPAQPTTSSEDNNNVRKRATPAAADSSEQQGYSYYDQGYSSQQHAPQQEQNGLSAFHRIRQFARYHPYQQPVSSTAQACDKCGIVTENLAEHVASAHPQPFSPFPFVKEEAQILDLDSQKVHVYPNGGEPPPAWPAFDDKERFFEEEKDTKPFFDDRRYLEDKERKPYFEDRRFLEENGNGASPDLGSVSTTSDHMPFFEPPKMPMLKQAGGATWKSNEARRPKTYNCTACNKWFTSSGHLKRHYNTTLHKNAVKQSGVLDPATLPISAHHHPAKEEDKPDPQPFPQQHFEEYEYQPVQYQYPNSSPPHVLSTGSGRLPSFEQGFQQVLQDYDVGGLYSEFHHFEDPLPDTSSALDALPASPDSASSPEPVTSSLESPLDGGSLDSLDGHANRRIEMKRIDMLEAQQRLEKRMTPLSLDGSIDSLDRRIDIEHRIEMLETQRLERERMNQLMETRLHIEGQMERTQAVLENQIQPQAAQAPVVSSTQPTVHRCLDCDKTFNKACYLTQHNKSFHSGEKPYKCARCGKRFPLEYLHLEHLQKHGGDKPHKCDVCPKQFNHKTDLRRHMCLHSGDKPFACSFCGKGFIRKDHMLKHADTHRRKAMPPRVPARKGLDPPTAVPVQ